MTEKPYGSGSEQEEKRLAREHRKRKKAEDALLESKQRYDRIADSIPGVIYDYVCWPDGKSRFIYMSSGCREIFEYDAQQITADTGLLWRMVHPDDLERLKSEDREANRTGNRLQSEVRIIVPSGRLKWIQLISLPIGQMADSRIIWSGVILDITDRKRAEEEKELLDTHLRQAQKMEALGRMAGSVAHHFNNELSVVQGNLELALEGLDRDPGIKKYLFEAMKAARRSARLGSQMLTYIGQNTGRKKAVDLSDFCRLHIHEILDGLPDEVCLDEQLQARGTVVHANTDDLVRVVACLVENSLEAMEDGPGALRVLAESAGAADTVQMRMFPAGWDFACRY
ncbi:MAG: PAS domain-containing protein [Desulfobacterales bacterium]|nr:PAS domain-containing protein [Desulfobacterales bacterium]